MGKKANLTLGEVMGKSGAASAQREPSLHDLPALLGEGMPKLEYHALGRLRLMRALKQRFGEGFRNVPGISSIITKFDQEAHTEAQHHAIRKKLGRK